MLHSIHEYYIGMAPYYIAVCIWGQAIYLVGVLYSWVLYSTSYDDVLYSIIKLLY